MSSKTNKYHNKNQIYNIWEDIPNIENFDQFDSAMKTILYQTLFNSESNVNCKSDFDMNSSKPLTFGESGVICNSSKEYVTYNGTIRANGTYEVNSVPVSTIVALDYELMKEHLRSTTPPPSTPDTELESVFYTNRQIHWYILNVLNALRGCCEFLVKYTKKFSNAHKLKEMYAHKVYINDYEVPLQFYIPFPKNTAIPTGFDISTCKFFDNCNTNCICDIEKNRICFISDDCYIDMYDKRPNAIKPLETLIGRILKILNTSGWTGESYISNYNSVIKSNIDFLNAVEKLCQDTVSICYEAIKYKNDSTPNYNKFDSEYKSIYAKKYEEIDTTSYNGLCSNITNNNTCISNLTSNIDKINVQIDKLNQNLSNYNSEQIYIKNCFADIFEKLNTCRTNTTNDKNIMESFKSNCNTLKNNIEHEKWLIDVCKGLYDTYRNSINNCETTVTNNNNFYNVRIGNYNTGVNNYNTINADSCTIPMTSAQESTYQTLCSTNLTNMINYCSDIDAYIKNIQNNKSDIESKIKNYESQSNEIKNKFKSIYSEMNTEWRDKVCVNKTLMENFKTNCSNLKTNIGNLRDNVIQPGKVLYSEWSGINTNCVNELNSEYTYCFNDTESHSTTNNFEVYVKQPLYTGQMIRYTAKKLNLTYYQSSYNDDNAIICTYAVRHYKPIIQNLQTRYSSTQTYLTNVRNFLNKIASGYTDKQVKNMRTAANSHLNQLNERLTRLNTSISVIKPMTDLMNTFNWKFFESVPTKALQYDKVISITGTSYKYANVIPDVTSLNNTKISLASATRTNRGTNSSDGCENIYKAIKWLKSIGYTDSQIYYDETLYNYNTWTGTDHKWTPGDCESAFKNDTIYDRLTFANTKISEVNASSNPNHIATFIFSHITQDMYPETNNGKDYNWDSRSWDEDGYNKYNRGNSATNFGMFVISLEPVVRKLLQLYNAEYIENPNIEINGNNISYCDLNSDLKTKLANYKKVVDKINEMRSGFCPDGYYSDGTYKNLLLKIDKNYMSPYIIYNSRYCNGAGCDTHRGQVRCKVDGLRLSTKIRSQYNYTAAVWVFRTNASWSNPIQYFKQNYNWGAM